MDLCLVYRIEKKQSNLKKRASRSAIGVDWQCAYRRYEEGLSSREASNCHKSVGYIRVFRCPFGSATGE